MQYVCLAAMVALIAVLYYYGKRAEVAAQAELTRLRSKEHYGRMCVVVDKGRELRCRVREYNVKPGVSRLWCVDPISHPNGWTLSFDWPNDRIEWL